MTQGERVKEVRKTLCLTLDKFGERLGIKKSTLSLIENDKSNLTEANIKAICREFSVDYIWLTTGKGEMFIESDADFIEKIDRIMANEDDVRKNLFKFMVTMNDDDIAALNRLMTQAIEYVERLRSESDEEKQSH